MEVCSQSGLTLAAILGSLSDNLICIDFDDPDHGLAWDGCNPELAGLTTRNRGARGWKIWLRIEGAYPPSEKTDQCEWRADGQLAIWSGMHPSGQPYRILNRHAPAKVAWEDIKWPEGWTVPGLRRLEEAALDELREAYGEPWHKTPKGEPFWFNETFWAGFYAREHVTLFSPEEESFYSYCADWGGWEVLSRGALRQGLSHLLLWQAKVMHVPWLERQRGSRMLGNLLSQVENVTVLAKAFERPRNQEPRLHLANTMLVWRGDRWMPEPFSPDYHSRNACPIHYKPGAECPRFVNELLKPCLSEEDISLLQRIFGLFLLGYNLPQIIVILDGDPGTGKSQIASVMRLVIGPHNTSNLRTDLLIERFELSHYAGKTLLMGSDVSAGFFNCHGAAVLKSLVGGDLLMAEFKGVQRAQPLQGNFNILVTSNTRLNIRIEGDSGAWKRRLVILTASGEPPAKIIPDFGEYLVGIEGPGILNWAIEGLNLFFQDLRDNGRMHLSTTQKNRIERILTQSDSLRIFVSTQLRFDTDTDLSSAEILTAYAVWARDADLVPVLETVAVRLLPTLMLEIFGRTASHDIARGGKLKRGFSKTALVNPAV